MGPVLSQPAAPETEAREGDSWPGHGLGFPMSTAKRSDAMISEALASGSPKEL